MLTAAAKGNPRQDDPAADLRDGWATHVVIALAHLDMVQVVSALHRRTEVLQGKIDAVTWPGHSLWPQARAMASVRTALDQRVASWAQPVALRASLT